MAAMVADFLVGLPVAHEQHLFALGTFQPEILRRLLAGDQRPELGPDEIGQPVHGGGIARMAGPAKIDARQRQKPPKGGTNSSGFFTWQNNFRAW